MGKPRTTTDIDIVIQPSPHIADQLINAFKKGGFDVLEEQIRSAFQEGYNASIYVPNSVIRIDLKLARKLDEREVLEQAKNATYKNTQFKIASVEQILYGKILYLGDISDLEDSELLDFNDAKDFVNVYNTVPTFDIQWLEQKAKQKGLQKTLNRLIKVAKQRLV